MTDTARARLRGVLQKPEGSDEALVFTASSTGLNRYGFALRNNGWRLDNFRNNPVVLWLHKDTEMPIGRAEAELRDGVLETAITFDRDDEFAATIERKYRGGFLNAVSVGFDFVDRDGKPILQWHRMSADDIQNRAHYDLAEVSAVPVPADPQATVRQRSMLAASLMDDFFHDTDNVATELTQLWQRAGDGLPQLDAPPGSRSNTDLDMRIQELESGLSVLKTALVAKAVHHTATEDSEWDGSAAVAAMPENEATLWSTHAWRDPQGDPDAKSTYKFPHHRTSGGPANLNACRAILSGRGAQADIPAAELEAARRHAQAHLDDASGGEPADEAAFTPQTAADFLAAIRLQHPNPEGSTS